MAHLYWYLRALLGTLLSDDRAQDTVEYLLIIGAVSVVIIGAMALAFPGNLVDAVCSVITDAFSAFSCGQVGSDG